MATYRYIARNAAGEKVVGTLSVDSQALALRALEEQQLYPVRVYPEQPSPLQRSRRVRTADLAMVYGQLADLLNAGVPMLRALRTLGRTAWRGPVQQCCRQLAEDVGAGASLVEAMGKQAQVFPALHVAMVRAGERGGFLESVLMNLSAFLERQDQLRAKVRGAMTYPLVLVLAGLGAMGFILLVLVPKFKPMFEDVPLPLPTRMLFAGSDLLLDGWPVLLMGLGLAVALLAAAVRSPAGRMAWERWRMQLPGVGRAVRMVAITRFCRILGTLLHNGVPILQALAISREATGSAVLAEAVAQAQTNVQAGQSLTSPLQQCRLFPAEVIEMIAVAEESNQLDKVLVKIAETLDRRTSQQVDQAVRLLEPVLLTVLAGAIAFMALGLVIPIFKMAQTIQ